MRLDTVNCCTLPHMEWGTILEKSFKVTLISDSGNNYESQNPHHVWLYTNGFSKPSEPLYPHFRGHESSDLLKQT